MPTTWDPANRNASIALSGGNLTATSSAGSGSQNCAARATTALVGKLYFEVTFSSSASAQYYSVGVMNGSASLSANIGASNGAAWANKLFTPSFSQIYLNGTGIGTFGLILANAQVLRVAVDRTANRVWWAINNNTWSGSSVWMGSNGGFNDDPGTGVGGQDISTVTGAIYPAFSSAWTGDVAVLNPGPSMAYAVPSGFSAIDAAVAGASQARVMVLA